MRDETLQRMMSEAVEGIDPRPEDSLRRVMGRGSRRRAVRWTAIGSALAAFVLVVAGAGLWVVDHQGKPAAPGITNGKPHPVVVDRFPVGPRGQSTALTAGGGYLWVAAYGIEAKNGEGLIVVDPNNGKVVATIPAPVPSWGSGGGGLTYAFGSIWVGGWDRRDGVVVTRIDPQTFEVQARIPMPEGRGPSVGVADIDAASASVWVALQGGVKDEGRVVRVNGTTNEVTGEMYVPQETARRIVATDEVVIVQGSQWRHGGYRNAYNAIDPDSMELRGTFDSGVYAGPAAGIVEHDGDIWGLYSEGPDRQGIARLDPMTAEPFTDRTLFPPNRAPRSFVISGGGGIWFGAYPGGSGGSGDNLSFLDTQTHAITTYGKGGGIPTMLGGDLWFLGWDGVLERVVLDGTSSPTAATPNPCDLLQSWEVERELDIQLNEVRWMESDEFHKPPKPWPDGMVACRYGSDGRVGDVFVSMRQMELEEFRRQFVDRSWAHPLEGIGDETVFNACGSVFAYEDGVMVQVGAQRGRCDDKGALISLTRLALERARSVVPPS